jgi:hypothetical protein
MRHPDTELASQYSEVSETLVSFIAEFFAGISLKTCSGIPTTPEFLARLFHDVWSPSFYRLISVEEQTLAEHEIQLRMRILPLVHQLFDEECIAHPMRKGMPE